MSVIEKNVEDLHHAAAAVDLVDPLLTDALKLLQEIRAMDEETRRGLARPLAEFEGMAPELLAAVASRPHLAASVGFDGDRVARQLRLVATLTALLGKVKAVEQRLADIHAGELSDAWRACLEIYGVAKVAERRDPGLREVISPMAEAFRNRASARSKVMVAKPPGGDIIPGAVASGEE